MQIHNLNIDQRELSEREQSILRTIINLYIFNATPVGSRNLSKFLEKEMKLSPATIRNTMADLEEMEYISHPHTSAGRVPTDKGYRFYVNNLPNVDLSDTAEFKSISNELEQSQGESILKDAGRILGLISHYLAVVRIPSISNLILQKIELLRLSSSHILIIIAFDSNIVKTVTLEIPYLISEQDIHIVGRIINEKLCGKEISFIQQNFRSIVNEINLTNSSPLIGLFVDSIDKIIDTHINQDKLHIAGTQNLLNLPEFEDITRVRSLMELMENEDALISIIDSKSCDYSDDVQISIGSELNSEFMEDYSIVLSSYKFGSATGSIGLIGPRRMNYSKVISLVKHVSDTITNK